MKTADTHQPSILGFGGSPRRGGNTDILLATILHAAEEQGSSVESVQLRDMQFKGCIGCEKCRKDRVCTGLKDGMTPLYPKILDSRGLVLISPTHNYNITAWMKAFIDRLYCYYTFDDNRPRGWSSQLAGQGRKAVIAAIAEQVDESDMGFTMEAMRRPLEALGYEIVGELPVLTIFDKGKVSEHPDVLLSASRLGAELSRSLD